MTDLRALSAEDLHRLDEGARSEINNAYWLFTRCARGKPPSMVVPGAYKIRSAIRRERLRRRAIG